MFGLLLLVCNYDSQKIILFLCFCVCVSSAPGKILISVIIWKICLEIFLTNY